LVDIFSNHLETDLASYFASFNTYIITFLRKTVKRVINESSVKEVFDNGHGLSSPLYKTLCI